MASQRPQVGVLWLQAVLLNVLHAWQWPVPATPSSLHLAPYLNPVNLKEGDSCRGIDIWELEKGEWRNELILG